LTYRSANLQSCILYIYSTNISTEYFKHGIYSPFFSLQNAVCFIILTYLVPVLFAFYIQKVLKFKKIFPAPKSECPTIRPRIRPLLNYLLSWIPHYLLTYLGTAVAQCLRCCATNRKEVCSIPDGVIGIFHWYKILPIALWPWGRLSL